MLHRTMPSASAAAAAALLACVCAAAGADAKAFFAHYMVGGMSGLSQAKADVDDALACGIDAFAINVQDASSWWSVDTIDWLFQAAEGTDFKLFFSFDMNVLTAPADFIPLLVKYHNSSAYYTYEGGRPLVSTFNGGTLTFGSSSSSAGWQASFIDVLAADGIVPFFMPDFDDYTGTGSKYTASFFDDYPVVDGVFAWETAWPGTGASNTTVSSTVDAANLVAARAAGKPYMMPLSTLQFKHLSAAYN
ncbi:hypothetical protein HK405_006327, partial [Cladochytrium tenue]